METFFVVGLLVIAALVVKRREQAQRIVLLGSYLAKFRVETLMENVLSGYQRALGEASVERQAQVWRHLEPTEELLGVQFSSFVRDFAEVYEARARISRLPLALPFVTQAVPASTFDLRKLLSVHGQGIARAVANSQGRPAKAKAFVMMAELLLMQHSCHWFCRSKVVASARMLARHKTSHEQLLAAVSPETRQAYLALLARA
jgi:hypothetical protein